MAKKQFIRHLEFYGYPDQNGYSSYINGSNIDLSDIIEKNKEQDEEIEELEGEKADKKDLDELSGTVETLISAQTEFNDEILGAISGITDDINTLKDIDNMYGQQLSALTDGVNDALCGIQNLGDRVDDVVEDLNELSGKVETFSGETAEKFSDVWNELDKKLDKTEAEETYAKIADVPTKDELDTILEGYTTKEYIDSLGHITQEQGDARYAKIETVDALSDRLNTAVTDINTKIYDISGDVQTLSSTTNTRIGTLETNFETLRGETNRKISEISGTVETCNAKVAQNASNIAALQTEVERKANKTEVEALNTRITNLSDVVDTKVGKPEYETYKASVANQFNNMDAKKADKTEITRLDERIDEVNSRVDQEILDREANDTVLNNKIISINNEITEIKEQGVEHDNRITSLENGLEQEIIDREQGDLDLIGTSADTIFGAKAYAKDMKRLAIEAANLYTDGEVTALEGRFDQKFETVNMSLTAKADITYVDNSRNELKAELLGEISDSVEGERNERLSEEASLWTAVRANTRTIASNTTQIDYNSDRIDAITSWPGTDPNEYDDGGTGILDVLHREFHNFSTTMETQLNNKVNKEVYDAEIASLWAEIERLRNLIEG